MDFTATIREFACRTTVGRRAAPTGTILAGMYDSACPTDRERLRIGRSPPTITCRHRCRSWFGKFSRAPTGELRSESVIGVPEHAAFLGVLGLEWPRGDVQRQEGGQDRGIFLRPRALGYSMALAGSKNGTFFCSTPQRAGARVSQQLDEGLPHITFQLGLCHAQLLKIQLVEYCILPVRRHRSGHHGRPRQKRHAQGNQNASEYRGARSHWRMLALIRQGEGALATTSPLLLQ
jgi:hypothetical protein